MQSYFATMHWQHFKKCLTYEFHNVGSIHHQAQWHWHKA